MATTRQETKQDIRQTRQNIISIIGDTDAASPVSVTQQLEQAVNPVSQTPVAGFGKETTTTVFSLVGSTASTKDALPNMSPQSNTKSQSVGSNVQDIAKFLATGSDGTCTLTNPGKPNIDSKGDDGPNPD